MIKMPKYVLSSFFLVGFLVVNLGGNSFDFLLVRSRHFCSPAHQRVKFRDLVCDV